MPPLPLIMIIRHGEKPTPKDGGVTLQGQASPHSLSVLGWQRAGALVGLFANEHVFSLDSGLASPTVVYAASPDAPGAEPEAKSRREEETIGPLCDALRLVPDLSFGKGQEAAVAAAALRATGPVLLCWEHKNIPKLVRAFPVAGSPPSSWPADRFDMTFLLRDKGTGTYEFSQVPQRLLAGDTDIPIA